MITAQVKMTKENTWDFIKFYMLLKTGRHKMMLAVYICTALVMAAAGVITCIVTGEPVILVITAAAILILAAYAGFFMILMKNTAKNLFKATEKNDAFSVSLDENMIFIGDSEKPVMVYDWGQAEEIYEAPKAVYILIKDGALIIIEYSAITEDSKKELLRLVKDNGGKSAKRAKK